MSAVKTRPPSSTAEFQVCTVERHLLIGQLAALSALVSCTSSQPGSGWLSQDWSVDTVTVIGVESGNENQEFGRLIAAESTESGDVFVLDLLRPGVLAFDAQGRFARVTGIGAGPGELRQPRAISLDRADRLHVLDTGNGRIVRFGLDRNGLTPLGSVPLQKPARSLCVMAGRLFISFLDANMMVHELGDDGAILRSFAEAPELSGLDQLDPLAATLARRQILAGKFFCDSGRGQIVVAASSHPLVRSYDASGVIHWEARLTDVTPIGFRIDANRALHARYDPDKGANFVRSMVRWDDRHLLIQYELRLPGDPHPREFHAIDSRLVSLDTGKEVGRRHDLPLLAAARGDRFVIIENIPFPRALVVRRRPATDAEWSATPSDTAPPQRSG